MGLSRTFIKTFAACLLSSVCSHADAAITWSEIGEAGDTLPTANVTSGVGSLDAIIGTLPDADPNNVDIFALTIPDFSLFSATTDNFPDTDLFDSWLYLFDDSGRGLAASATTAGGSPNATISLGSVTGTAGLYYLAITRFDTFPESVSGAIFPDLYDNSTNGEVLGPTGPGGLDPLSSWSAPSQLDFENYRIDLTGAEPAPAVATVVPEPSSLLLWAVPLFAVCARRKKPRRSRARA